MSPVTTEFSEAVYWFLRDHGYTHIYLKGIQEPDAGFRLVPLMPDSSIINIGEPNELIAALDDPEMMELTKPIPDITVLVELTVGEYAAYLLTVS